jgi:hypothetical protein
MSESGALARSGRLARSALRVLQSHPKLVLFPLTGLVSAIVGLTPIIWFFIEISRIKAGTASAPRIMALTPFGFVSPFLFFLTLSLASGAFYHECTRALAGEPVLLGRGLRAALSRLRVLIVWHAFSGLATYLTRLVGGQFGLGGRIAEALVGLGWGAASFFVLPIIMREPKQKPDPVALARKSTALLRTTWGESVCGFVGMSILSAPVFIIVIAAILMGRGIFGPAVSGLVRDLFLSPFGLGLVGVLILWVIGVSLAGAVYRCALYVYATEGAIPGEFTEDQLNAAWKLKGRA